MNILVFGKDGQLGRAFQSVFTDQRLGEHRIHYVGRAQCDLSNADAISNLLRETKPNLIYPKTLQLIRHLPLQVSPRYNLKSKPD